MFLVTAETGGVNTVCWASTDRACQRAKPELFLPTKGDARAQQGLPFHNSLISAPDSISKPEWLDIHIYVRSHLHAQESDGAIELQRGPCLQPERSERRRAIIIKDSKLSASYESNDPDKWHMAQGDPIKTGQKVMEAA